MTTTMQFKMLTRAQMMAKIGDDTMMWSATCETYDDDSPAHVVAWDWLRGGESAEGVEIVRGTVRVTAPDGTRYRVTA